MTHRKQSSEVVQNTLDLPNDHFFRGIAIHGSANVEYILRHPKTCGQDICRSIETAGLGDYELAQGVHAGVEDRGGNRSAAMLSVSVCVCVSILLCVSVVSVCLCGMLCVLCMLCVSVCVWGVCERCVCVGCGVWCWECVCGRCWRTCVVFSIHKVAAWLQSSTPYPRSPVATNKNHT